MLLLSLCAPLDSTAAPGEAETLLHRPLLVGASITADRGTMSPGRRAALEFTDPSEIVTIARSGWAGKRILRELGPNALRGRSIVVGVDLFFWDSLEADPQESVKAMKALVDRAARENVPLMLSEVPELIAGKQPGRPRLNREILRLCKIAHGCYTIPLDQLHRRIVKEGGLRVGQKFYAVNELLPDGVHLSDPAAQYLAEGIEEILER